MTEIAYVLSPDRDHYLYTSLHTLFRSGSTFDCVKICCVGEQPNERNFSDPRIVVEAVSPLTDDYFHINKTYSCQSSEEAVVLILSAVWQSVTSKINGIRKLGIVPSGRAHSKFG